MNCSVNCVQFPLFLFRFGILFRVSASEFISKSIVYSFWMIYYSVNGKRERRNVIILLSIRRSEEKRERTSNIVSSWNSSAFNFCWQRSSTSKMFSTIRRVAESNILILKGFHFPLQLNGLSSTKYYLMITLCQSLHLRLEQRKEIKLAHHTLRLFVSGFSTWIPLPHNWNEKVKSTSAYEREWESEEEGKTERS